MMDGKPIVPIPTTELRDAYLCVTCDQVAAKRIGMKCPACVQALVEDAKMRAVTTVIDSSQMIQEIQDRKAEVGYADRGKAYRRGAVDHDQAKATAKQAKAARRKARQKANKRKGRSG